MKIYLSFKIHLMLFCVLNFFSFRFSLSEEIMPEWVKKLPSNQWTKLDQGKSGNRIGAKVLWLEKEEKLVLEGGLIGKSNRETPKPGKMIFEVSKNEWQEYKNEPSLPKEFVLTIKDSSKKLVVNIKLPIGFEDLAGEKIASNSPLGNLSNILPFQGIIGGVYFFDSINKEVHIVGGAVGSAELGGIGNWVYSISQNSWNKSTIENEALKNLRKEIKSECVNLREIVASGRNLHYSEISKEDLQSQIKNSLFVRINQSIQNITTLILNFEKEKGSLGIDSKSTEKAEILLKEVLATLKDSKDTFEAGILDAKTIKNLEGSGWKIDEANDFLASEPTPRLNAMGIYDPEHKIFVLHGGDHGDYILSDTWHYDCVKKKWNRVYPLHAPSVRFSGQMFWLPKTKTIALLSGSTYLNKMKYQSFSTKLGPDVWLYDPAKISWTMLVNPGEEIMEKSPDNYPWFIVNNPVIMTQFGVLICPAVGGNSYQDFMTSSTWMLKLDANAADNALTEKLGIVSGQRVYRSQFVKEYNPQWYDEASRLQKADIDLLIATIPTNQWVEMPLASRPCPERSWGTSLYDPDRDQIYFWTGGHCADPADIMHHFHPGSNIWSIPYIAGGIMLGNQFTGRPDCQNHTYKNYAYDPISKKIIATHRAGTHVYDPNKRDWTGFTMAQPFIYNVYSSKCLSTPLGVVAWAGGCNDGGGNGLFFEIFDEKKMKWSALPVKGAKIPNNVHGDEGGMTWDSKRKLIYINAAIDYEKPNGKIYQYNPNSQEMVVVDPKNKESIGDKFHTYRETVYLPEIDLVLFGMGFLNNKQIAYDPAGNRWVLTNILKTSAKAIFDSNTKKWSFATPKPDQKVGSITFCPTLDLKRNLLWAPSDYQGMYVMKIDPKSIILSEAVK